MKKNPTLLFAMLLLFSTSCRVFQKNASLKDDGQIEIVFVQVNDVYEIAPLNGGKEGEWHGLPPLKRKKKPRTPILIWLWREIS